MNLNNNELARQMRASRPRSTAQLPSERTGVICQPKSNTFLCNGWGCAHPADLRPGFYYPLSKTQIKQLRRAAAAHELSARKAGKGLTAEFPGVFVPNYAQSVGAWFACMKDARHYRKRYRKELKYQRKTNVPNREELRAHIEEAVWELHQAKETRYTLYFINRLP